MGTAFQLAPVALLRMGSWPRSTLNKFGDSELARLALIADRSSADNKCFHERYRKVLTHERRELHRLTIEDTRFIKALILSNPLLAERIRNHSDRLHLSHPRNKWVRKLEHTVYRYLARAAGRPVPCGVWAGITMVHFGDQDRISYDKPRYYFAPDLRLFQLILRMLAQTKDYRYHSSWKLNPTIVRQDDGSWFFLSKATRSPTELRLSRKLHLKFTSWLDPVLNVLLTQPPAKVDQLASKIAKETGLTKDAAENILIKFIELGVLVGELDLPCCFASPGEALQRSTRYLLPEHQSPWKKAIHELGDICEALASDYDDFSIDQVVNYIAKAEDVIEHLKENLGIPQVEHPQPILRVDYKVPFSVEVGRKTQAKIEFALELYLGHRHAMGMGPAFRTMWWKRLQKKIGSGLRLDARVETGMSSPLSDGLHTWQSLAEFIGGGRELERRIKRWELLLQSSDSEVTAPSGPQDLECPLGCLVVGIPHFGDPEINHIVFVGLLDEPIPMYARFSPLLNPGKRTPYDPLYLWLRKALWDIKSHTDIEIIEYAGYADWNPNTLARPSFGFSTIAPFHVYSSPSNIRQWKLWFDRKRNIPLVKINRYKNGERLQNRETAVVFSFCSAPVTVGDPIAEHLLTTSFRDRPLPVQAAVIPYNGELSRKKTSPRVRLQDGTIIRSRRTYISENILETLATSSPTERFKAWHFLAKENKWPELVAVRMNGSSPILIRRDSPLGLEAVFKGVSGKARMMVIEEPDMFSSAEFPDGQSYAMEIAFPLRFREHMWNRGIS